MSEAGKTEDDKARASAYSAATTALRNKFESEFQKLLQAEYDKRGLGEAPLTRAAQKKIKEDQAKRKLAEKLAKKRQELEDLEAAAEEAGLEI